MTPHAKTLIAARLAGALKATTLRYVAGQMSKVTWKRHTHPLWLRAKRARVIGRVKRELGL
jgi:hypothetical protein